MASTSSPGRLSKTLSEAQPMLLDAQRAIDDGLWLAALVVSVADGKLHTTISAKKAEQVARGMVSSRNLVALASYLTDPAMADGQATKAGLLRHISGYFDI